MKLHYALLAMALPVKSGGGPPHSKTLRACRVMAGRASVMECAGPPALSLVQDGMSG